MTRDTRRPQIAPRGSRILAAALGVIALASLISTAISNPADTLGLLPVYALVVWAAWSVLWHPHVEIDDTHVTIVNILRTHRIPLAAISEVSTRWGLVVTVGEKRYPAWAAPAPGTLHTMRIDPKGLTRLPESSYEQGTVRPADDPVTDSGAAALGIRRGMDAQGAQAPGTKTAVVTTWHTTLAVLGAICLVLTVWTLL